MNQPWTPEELLFYTSYYVNGNPLDRMFGGFIFNGISVKKDRYLYPMYVGFANGADQTDWLAWIDTLFAPDRNLKALYSLATQSTFDVWVSIPYPYLNQKDFGSVNGKPLDFERDEDRFAAVAWWIDQFLLRWQQEPGLATRLHFRGFLWQRESIHNYDENLVISTVRYVKGKGHLMMWLPFFGSYGCLKLKELDFDLVVIHPNYQGNTTIGTHIFNDACFFAKNYQTGMQIVFGKGSIYSETHLLDYLNLGLPQHHGYQTDSFLVYQFPQQRLHEVYAQRFDDYVRLYLFIKGHYTETPYPGMNY